MLTNTRSRLFDGRPDHRLATSSRSWTWPIVRGPSSRRVASDGGAHPHERRTRLKSIWAYTTARACEFQNYSANESHGSHHGPLSVLKSGALRVFDLTALGRNRADRNADVNSTADGASRGSSSTSPRRHVPGGRCVGPDARGHPANRLEAALRAGAPCVESIRVTSDTTPGTPSAGILCDAGGARAGQCRPPASPIQRRRPYGGRSAATSWRSAPCL